MPKPRPLFGISAESATITQGIMMIAISEILRRAKIRKNSKNDSEFGV